jgi:outer membrane protein
MKNLSLALNGVLLVAVGILYYLHFTGGGQEKSVEKTAAPSTGSDSSSTAPASPASLTLPESHILFVNTDSLFERAGILKKANDDFESKKKKMENEINGRLNALQKKYMEAQQKVQSGLVTMEQAQQLEQELMMEQQKLGQYKDEMEEKLIKENEFVSSDLNKKITVFLKKQSRQSGVKFILGYKEGGGILFADDSLDVTKQVVEGLNREYGK